MLTATNQDREYVYDTIGRVCSILPIPEDFMRHRKTGMGGTDSSTVAGLTPKSWGSLLSLYADKVSNAKSKDPDDLRFKLGHALERFVIDEGTAKAAKEYGQTARVVATQVFVRAKANGEILGSLDSIIDVGGTPMILDAKTTVDYEEGAPARPNYWAQLQHYMGVTGIRHACLSTLDLTTRKIHNKYLTLDDEAWGILLDGDLRFWRDHVIAGKAPPANPEYAMVDYDAIRRLYPVPDPDKVISLPAEFDNDFARLKEISAICKQLEQEEKAIKARVRMQMADATFGVLPASGNVFSVSRIQRSGYYVEPTEYVTMSTTTFEAMNKKLEKKRRELNSTEALKPKAKVKKKAEPLPLEVDPFAGDGEV